MTRRGIRIVRVINKTTDFCVFFGSFVFGYLTCFCLDRYNSPTNLELNLYDLQLLFILYMATNLIVMLSSPIYPANRLRSFSEVAWIYFKSVAFPPPFSDDIYMVFFIKSEPHAPAFGKLLPSFSCSLKNGWFGERYSTFGKREESPERDHRCRGEKAVKRWPKRSNETIYSASG